MFHIGGVYEENWTGVYLLVVTSSAQAARPFNTDDAGTVEPGRAEVEIAYEFVDQSEEENNVSVVATAGVTDRWDVTIDVPYRFIDSSDGIKDRDGFSDVTVSTKWTVLKEHQDLPDTAVTFAYKADSGDSDRGLGTGEPEYIVTGVLSWFGESAAHHLNLGQSLKEGFEDAFNYSAAVEYTLSQRLRAGVEMFGDTTWSGDFDENPFSVQAGFNGDINERMTWDAGVTAGLSDAAPDMSVTTGLTFRF